MIAVPVFVFLSVLLVCGKILRVRIPLLQRLYLPSSVIGGLLGLALMTAFPGLVPEEWVAAVRSCPGFLINIIFAALFLGVAANWLPLLAICLAGTLLSLLMVVHLAPRLFREAWFERAIAEFGQSTGGTATGLLLLRTVDPEHRTVAAASFGYKQLLHEPFMGGGLWTAFAFTLVYAIGWFKVWALSVAMTLFWAAVAAAIVARNRRRA